MANCSLPRTPAKTKYARYIGRVGALAVALGIGTAVAPGIAWATTDPDTSGAETSDTATAGQDTVTDGSPDSGTQAGATDAPTPPSSTVAAQTVASSNDPAEPPDATTRLDPRDGVVQATGGLNTTVTSSAGTTAATTTPTASPPKSTSPNEPVPAGEPAPDHDAAPTPPKNKTGDSTPRTATTSDDPAPASTLSTARLARGSVSPSLASVESGAFSMRLSTEAVSAAATPSTAVVTPSAIPPAQVQPQVNPIAAIVRPIVSLAVGLFGLAGDPTTPVEPPLG
jgi:hypothetical protein